MSDAEGLAGDPRRRVVLEAVHNFRDLGGYPAAGGRCLRWNRLYRADGLYRLTAGDVAQVRALGVRTVVDLRTDTELAERGRYPLDVHPVAYHHHPVIDATWDLEEAEHLNGDPGRFLANAYLQMLEHGAEAIGRVIEVLSHPDALPAVFHCAAGKDRTGLTAAILLCGLGVPDEFVVADYALSHEAMARTREWASASAPELAERYDRLPAGFVSALPAAMETVLEHLRGVAGGTRGYIAAAGVGHDVWSRLEAALLVPAEAAAD